MTNPDLSAYDLIVVNSSGGKDSQAMLDVVVRLAGPARVVVVHADLGRVEWAGTKELAARQAAHYGVPFEAIARPQGDLLTHIEQRGRWPSSTTRYCTSDHKRGQVATVITKLTKRLADKIEREQRVIRPVRVLNCMGIRAQESSARAKKVAFARDARLTNGKRTVDTWFPIFDWTVEQVWERIVASGVEHHRAYDLGMKRLSCCFCVFAPKSALMVAGQHNPALLDEYVAVEQKIGHRFTMALSIESVRDAIRSGAAITMDDQNAWCL